MKNISFQGLKSNFVLGRIRLFIMKELQLINLVALLISLWMVALLGKLRIKEWQTILQKARATNGVGSLI